MINLGVNFLPHLDCEPNGSGQIWLLQYPYTSKQVLLDDPNASYFYPSWSPDGKWIAYVQSEAGTKMTRSDELGSILEGEDSVWVMRPDGSEKRMLAKTTRIDYDIVSTGCLTVASIDTPLHWSADGRYIAFLDNQPEPEDPSSYIVEVETGQTHRISGGVTAPPEWWPAGNTLAIVNSEVTLIDAENFTSQKVPFSPEMPDDFRITNSVWSLDGQSLLVIGYDRSVASAEAASAVWRMDIQTNQWQKLADVGNVGKDYRVAPSSGKAWAAECQAATSGSDRLVLLDPTTWKPVGAVDGPGPFCDTVQSFEDQAGDDVIAFIEAQPESWGKNIWAVKAKAGELSAQQIVDGERLKMPDNLHIVGFSPKP